MGSPAFREFDADQVTINISGIPINSGYADGEFVRIEKTREAFTVYEGTDGEITRSKTNSKLYNIKIRLGQSSLGNSLLSALFNTDQAGVNGAGVGAILIQDRQGTTLFSGSRAWISKPPDTSFDRESKEREWEIQAILDVVVWGNN